MKKISLIFLSGGIGSRLKKDLPKQYIPIKDKILALYSFETFLKIDLIKEIVIVAKEEYRHFFKSQNKKILFASPGNRRQDSVYNGLLKISDDCNFVCIHDSARPFIDIDTINKLILETNKHDAVALGAKVTNTIKEVDEKNSVIKTLNRETLYEIQTPQIISYPLLNKGYDFIIKNNLEVTDDTSIVEKINKEVHIVNNNKINIKITTLLDLNLAKLLLNL